MGNQPKPRNCKPQHRTRVVLDAGEIQRRMSKPKRPSLAEQYAEATDAAQRERFYAEATDLHHRQRAVAEANRRSAPLPPRRPKATVWVTQPILRTRGWTAAAIRDFLPEPERYQSNPHLLGARRPMPLWRAETVGRIEATVEWQDWLDRSLARRRIGLGTLRGARNLDFHRRTSAVNAAVAACRRAERHRLQ